MINILIPLTIILATVIIGELWAAAHTCAIDWCGDWTSETGPDRLCPHHRAQQTSDMERHWADTIRRAS